jgi:hypothetical protein
VALLGLPHWLDSLHGIEAPITKISRMPYRRNLSLKGVETCLSSLNNHATEALSAPVQRPGLLAAEAKVGAATVFPLSFRPVTHERVAANVNSTRS